MSIKDKLYKFLGQINGVDYICCAAVVLYALINLFEIFLHLSLNSIFKVCLLAYLFFRIFSKNLYKRQNENLKFIKFLKDRFNCLKILFNKIKDSKTHIYRRCSHCNAILRLPRKKGSHTVLCPACGNEFKVRIKF